MKSRLLANLNWLFADKILRIIGGLLIGIWMARYLGIEQFGKLNYALAFVALFGNVAKLGIDQIVVREITQSPEREGAVLGSILVLKLLASMVAFAIVVPTAWLVEYQNTSFLTMVTIIASGMLFNAADAYDIYYQAHISSRTAVVARSISFLILSVVRVGLILAGYPIIYFAIAATAELAIGGIFLVLSYRTRRKLAQKWYFDQAIMRSLLKDGWSLIVSSALIVIHTRIDQVMIGHMLGNADVGIYSAAVRLSESWLFVPAIIVQTVTPYFMTIRKTNITLYHARLVQLYSIMFWLGTVTGTFTVLFGELFIVTLFGEEFRAAYWPLVLTIWVGIFISQAVARGIWLVAENIQAYRLVNNLIAVPMNILLNWWLIPIYGVIGASIASLISIGISTWVIPFLFKPMRLSNWQMLRAVNPKYLFLRTI